ncbi:hypothetical protein [Secundilactobacillus muriivasis]
MNTKNVIAGYNRHFQTTQQTRLSPQERAKALLQQRQEKSITDSTETPTEPIVESTPTSTDAALKKQVRQLKKALKRATAQEQTLKTQLAHQMQENRRLKSALVRAQQTTQREQSERQTAEQQLKAQQLRVQTDYVTKQQHQADIDELTQALTEVQQQNGQLLSQRDRIGNRHNRLKEQYQQLNATYQDLHRVLANNELTMVIDALNGDYRNLRNQYKKLLRRFLQANEELQQRRDKRHRDLLQLLYRNNHLAPWQCRQLLRQMDRQVLADYFERYLPLEAHVVMVTDLVDQENIAQVLTLLRPLIRQLSTHYQQSNAINATTLTELEQLAHQEQIQIGQDTTLNQRILPKLLAKNKPLRIKPKQSVPLHDDQIKQRVLYRQVLKNRLIVVIDWTTKASLVRRLTQYGARVVAFNDDHYPTGRVQSVLADAKTDLIIINPDGMHHLVSDAISQLSPIAQKKILNVKQATTQNLWDTIISRLYHLSFPEGTMRE